MGIIRVHEFTTLDGVIDAPTWSSDSPFDPKEGEAIGGIMTSCSAILLGRHTFEVFAPAWSARTAEEDPGAPFMNDTPKYVVASTTPSVQWSNSTVIGSYNGDRIRALKDEVDGGIYVSGSGTLVRAMLDDGLVDELHLFVSPITLGSGQRLFANGDALRKFELLACEAYTSGTVLLSYRPKSG